MGETYVVNSSPLILFGKIRQLQLFSVLGPDLVIPKAVIAEVSVGPRGADVIQELLAANRCRIAPDSQVPYSVSRWDLGEGESQVLATALLEPEATVIIDDLAARKCARTHGLPLIGCAGLIGLFKKRGHIELAEPLLAALVRAGLRLSPMVLAAVLKEVGEAGVEVP